MSYKTAPFKANPFAQDDLIFHPMDLPLASLYFSEEVDVPSSAIPINTTSNNSFEVSDLFPELRSFEKLLSSSPNTFVNSEYGSLCAPVTSQTSANVPPCPTAKVIPDNVRLRNHDCMWSGRCNQQESHQQKMKMKAAAAAAALSAQTNKVTTPRPITPAQSPTKVRTIQAGESLLRLKQPNKGTASGNSSGDENNNNRPDTPQSLGGGEEHEITATTTGSNHLPLMSQKEQELMKIKEFLSDPAANKQYKAYDNSTTLADVIHTLESEHNSSSGGVASGGGNAGGQTIAGGGGGGSYPLSPADEDSDCSRGSMSHVVDDDTESEHEMDDEYSLHDDDEGISLKMMPTSHLSSSSRLGYETSSMSRMSMSSRLQAESEEEDTEEEDSEEEDDEEEDLKPDVNELNAMYHHHHQQHRIGEDEEDSGTERSLYGTTLTAQEKSLIMQQTSMHSDHCYTRVKSRVESQKLGVDTPSDSEEEIDVGGVGQKNLPTNPSAQDRKALQATVRNRFVRTSSGIMTAPPTVPNSGATTPGGRSASYYQNQNAIYAGYGAAATVMQAVATTKKMSHKQHQQRQMTKLDDYYDQESNSNSSISSSGRKIVSTQSHRKGGSSANRKRPASSAMGYSKSTKHYHDSKKSKYSGAASGKGGARSMQKGYGAGDYRNPVATFTLDKRNLHNDLERQRRVGLKNLFEELKCQIPSLRDKERAPKVSILREAANLCMELTREQETLFMLRKQREKLLHTARTLKTQLQRAAARSK